MTFPIKITLFFTMLAVGAGCGRNSEQLQAKARQDAEAKARADAARKEMQTLPKVFRTPNYLKKNEPAVPEPKAQANAEVPKK
jgi:hypothetical protein